jgi:hypothetical protein
MVLHVHDTPVEAARAPDGHGRVPMSRESSRLFEVEGWEAKDHSDPNEELD